MNSIFEPDRGLLPVGYLGHGTAARGAAFRFTLAGPDTVVSFACLNGTPFPWPHRVFVDSRWAVDPLDEASWARRGHLACFYTAERAVEAGRYGLHLQTRTASPGIASYRRGWWVAIGSSSPCSCYFAHAGPGFWSASAAAEHARSIDHLAARFRTEARILRAVLDAVPPPHSIEKSEFEKAAKGCVLEPDGIDRLWQQGVSPGFLIETRKEVSVRRGGLPSRAYLAAALALPQPGGLISRDPITQTMERTGLSYGAARAMTRKWASCDPAITIDDQVLAHYLSPLMPLPTPGAVDRLEARIDGLSRRTLALMLAVSGSVPAVETLVRRGARDALAAFTIMERAGL